MMPWKLTADRVQAVDYKKAIDTAKKHFVPKNVKVVMVCTANLFERQASKIAYPHKSITSQKIQRSRLKNRSKGWELVQVPEGTSELVPNAFERRC
jgi:hypothetical protein